eukprot:12419308-Karenia_brevis.AAC.1
MRVFLISEHIFVICFHRVVRPSAFLIGFLGQSGWASGGPLVLPKLSPDFELASSGVWVDWAAAAVLP